MGLLEFILWGMRGYVHGEECLIVLKSASDAELLCR